MMLYVLYMFLILGDCPASAMETTLLTSNYNYYKMLKVIQMSLVNRSICESVSSARWQEDQQKEDIHEKGRYKPYLQ